MEFKMEQKNQQRPKPNHDERWKIRWKIAERLSRKNELKRISISNPLADHCEKRKNHNMKALAMWMRRHRGAINDLEYKKMLNPGLQADDLDNEIGAAAECEFFIEMHTDAVVNFTYHQQWIECGRTGKPDTAVWN